LTVGQNIELLSPAKNAECGIAAVNHGADAVYIAGLRFGAREAAGNTMQEIAELCRYAHRYSAKVYLTLNTILYENELEEARRLAFEAWNAGCNALIVQDMAFAEMDLPPLPLFASTQADNCSKEKIKFLQDVGFKRIILARELSLKEIAEIRNETSVELEAFVHGSLCVACSGRCYMSQIIAGRSANRGVCAQPCRLPYDLCDDKGRQIAENKYLLSLKDLNLSDHLEKLLEAGVSSFKIEGRLKDLSYVKNITALYRRRLDAILSGSSKYAKASAGEVKFNFDPDPERSFSRGFSKYFAFGRSKGMSAQSSKSQGKYAGTVVSCNKLSFVLDKNVLENGDGICFFDAEARLSGTRVNRVENGCVFPLSMSGISVGLKIFCNSDRLFDKKLAGESAVRKIKTQINMLINTDKNVALRAVDETGIQVELLFENRGERSKSPEKNEQNIKNLLSKTGNSIFVFEIDKVAGEYFFPTSEINGWRRTLISKLEEARKQSPERAGCKITPNEIPYISDSVDFTANVSNSLSESFYRRHGVKQIEYAAECGTKINTLMFNKYCIKYELGLCPSKQNAKPSGELFLQHGNKKFKLLFDCKNCCATIVIQ
jgi:putative protease